MLERVSPIGRGRGRKRKKEKKRQKRTISGRNADARLIDDYASFSKINTQLLNPATPLKHIPVRIYIPSSPPGGDASGSATPGSFKVMQSLVAPRLPNNRKPFFFYFFFSLLSSSPPPPRASIPSLRTRRQYLGTYFSFFFFQPHPHHSTRHLFHASKRNDSSPSSPPWNR